MDIDRVRYFQTFVATGSLVKACEILHISQPALSKALRLLESEVGLQLIESDGRGLRLTESGKKFHQQSKPLLDQWLNLPKDIQKSQQQKPTRIGSFEVFTTYFLGHLLDQVSLHELEIHEYGPGRLEAAVANGLIDIGITYNPVPRPGIEFIEVGKIKMGLYGLKKKFDHTPFSELQFAIPLMPAEGTPSKVMGLDGWPDHRVERKIKYRVTMLESALELCRNGACVAYLPDFISHLHNQYVKAEYSLAELPCPLNQKERLQGVFLVYAKGHEETALHRNIAKCLRSLNNSSVRM